MRSIYFDLDGYRLNARGLDRAIGNEPVRGRGKRRRSVAAKYPVPGRSRMAPKRGEAPILSQSLLRRSYEAL